MTACVAKDTLVVASRIMGTMLAGTATAVADTTLAEIVRRIVGAISPDRIILFGSRARGQARPGSDYDLLVVKDTSDRTLTLARRAYRALVGAGGAVDLIVETPERLDKLRRFPGLFFADALRDGLIVYERPSAQRA